MHFVKGWCFKIATVLRMVRVLRTLRILKLSRYSRGLRILGTTLYRSARVLTLLVMFQMVLAITFGSFVYYLDIGRSSSVIWGHQRSNWINSDDSNAKQIRSIPEGIWWSLITMTTVGYGDKIPVSFSGKIAGSCCAMMGILCMSFPVPGLFSSFWISGVKNTGPRAGPIGLATDPSDPRWTRGSGPSTGAN